MKTSSEIIAYKIVKYLYENKHDSGLLIAAFKTQQDAVNYKPILIEQTKHEIGTSIYMIEPVYKHTDFISFLNSFNNSINF